MTGVKTEVWTLEKYQEHLAKTPAKKAHKYAANPVEIDGIRFDSQLEGRYYQHLKQLQEWGHIRGFIRQVPFHLPGKTRLVIDFGVAELNDSMTFVDVKGFETPEFKIKFRQAKELYPWAWFKIVKKGDF